MSGRLLDTHGSGAPEFESGNYNCQSDVFSFGVVLLELLTGRKSYDRSVMQFRVLSFSSNLWVNLRPYLSSMKIENSGPGLAASNTWLDGQSLSFMILIHYRKWSILPYMEPILSSQCHILLISFRRVYRCVPTNKICTVCNNKFENHSFCI